MLVFTAGTPDCRLKEIKCVSFMQVLQLCHLNSVADSSALIG